MLAISADGNRKHYRFKKSKGTDEPPLFDGHFMLQDSKVSAFVEQIRELISRSGHDSCGPATFIAGRETAKKSRAKVDEEGLEIAVCRHGVLLQALNHYRGEIYAYPMYLQKELSQTTRATFFCMDIACRYWPYLENMAEKVPELQPLTKMKPFLSVMHAKAHYTGKCEVRWGGRSQEGAGNTVGQEVEQVNSFLSSSTDHKVHDQIRADMITVLAMAWNNKKMDSLHKTLAKRYLKTTQRAENESANHESEAGAQHFSGGHRAVDAGCPPMEHAATDINNEQLQKEIEELIYSIKKKNRDIYRQNATKPGKGNRRLCELKKKLREKIQLYNAVAEPDDAIDTEAACSLSEDLILPWEVQGDVVSFRFKRQVFDQAMLVRRLEEEKVIQHCQYLKMALDKLDNLLLQDISNNATELTEEGCRGLRCYLLHKQHLLRRRLSAATSSYARLDSDPSFFIMEEDVAENLEECEEESDLDISSPEHSKDEL